MTPTKKRSTFATIVCAALSIPSAQCEFTMPRSDLKDNQQQFTTGDILPIVWNSGWKNGLYDQPERVDLWVTWFYQDGYKVKLKSNITLNENGKYNWTIDVPNEKIEAKSDGQASYVLRFLNHTESDVYPTTKPMLPSVGFILHESKEADTSQIPSPSSQTKLSLSAVPSTSPLSSAALSSPSTALSSTSTALSGPSTAFAVSSPSEEAKSSNTGAIAGGVLGGLAGVAFALVGALMLIRRLKKKNEEKTNPYEVNGQHADDVKRPTVYAHLAEFFSPPVEIYTPEKNEYAAELESMPVRSTTAPNNFRPGP